MNTCLLRLPWSSTRSMPCGNWATATSTTIQTRLMARIQEQHRKDFMLESCELGTQLLFDQRWRTELGTTLHLQHNGLACRIGLSPPLRTDQMA